MSLPPASAPVAVLVLAWDETIPAVRALVEAPAAAEPAPDSLVVLVPADPTTEELTPEEFLPLADSLSPLAELPLAELPEAPLPCLDPANAPAFPAASVQAIQVASSVDLPILEAQSALAEAVAALTPSEKEPQVALPLIPLVPDLATQGIPVAAVAGWPAVHVLRPTTYSLAALAMPTQQASPALAWTGTANPPAAPYLGSTPTQLPLGTTLGPVATVADFALAFAPALTTTPTPPTSGEADAPPERTGAPTPRYPVAKLPAALAAEAAVDPASLPLVPDAAATTSPAEVSEEIVTAAALVGTAPAQTSWPAEAPAAPSQMPADLAATAGPIKAAAALSDSPAVVSTPPPAPSEPAAHASQSALLPTPGPFTAPNLNFQIIQYARLAVPLALAAEPFAVIYAPAWPTWLAAQELRHRTGRPLVLHVAALAAADTEPLDLAAGWPAEIQRQALHRADLILTETPALAYRLRRELSLPAHRVRPVPAADTAAVALALSTAQVR